jgi:transcriptional regulator with XRE-family HTH domain/tetratricopeptide (TPR) repeat protein
VKDAQSFGSWLKQLRRTHQLTQEELAERLACSPSHIRKLEAGLRRPTSQLSERLAREFALPLGEIHSVVHSARAYEYTGQPTRPQSWEQSPSSAEKDDGPGRGAGETSNGQEANHNFGLKRALGHFQNGHSDLSEGFHGLTNALVDSSDQPTATRAKILHLAGALARVQADYTQAQLLHEQSLALYRGLGDDSGVAVELENLAWVALSRGDYERGSALATEGLALFRKLGDKRGIADSLNHLGWVSLDRGDHKRAEIFYQESLELAQELGDKQVTIYALNNLGEAARAQRDYARAATLYESSKALAQELGDTQGIAAALHNLAHSALHTQQPRKAASLFLESLAMFRRSGDKQGMAECLAGLGGVACRMELLAEAAKLLGAATALLEAIGSSFQSTDRMEYNRNLGVVCSALGDAAFGSSWSAGRAMMPDQAFAYASTLF